MADAEADGQDARVHRLLVPQRDGGEAEDGLHGGRGRVHMTSAPEKVGVVEIGLRLQRLLDLHNILQGKAVTVP